MRVFYRGPRVLITQHVFEAEQLGRLRYPLTDLTAVHIVRLEPEAGPSEWVPGLSALFVGLLVVPIVGLWSQIAVGVAAGAVVIGSVVNARRRPPVRWQLAATCHGRPVTLFESADQTEFDQVCRGLQRALEQTGGRRH